MRRSRTAILTAAAMVLAGAIGFAVADIKNSHLMVVALPDGTVARIRYAGDKPPRLNLRPVDSPFDVDSPYVEMDRIGAALDRQAALMINQAESLAAAPRTPGTYAMVSILGGDGVCTRSVRYTYTGDGKPPRILSGVSGSCRANGDGERSTVSTPAPNGQDGNTIAPHHHIGAVEHIHLHEREGRLGESGDGQV